MTFVIDLSVASLTTNLTKNKELREKPFVKAPCWKLFGIYGIFKWNWKENIYAFLHLWSTEKFTIEGKEIALRDIQA